MPVGVSVCIPMYNNAATIERCLTSILAQQGVDFEIVVVDDDSSDDGPEIVQSLLRPRDRLVRNRIRLGLNGNHNRCLELARGDYVQFVHADDWLLPGALATLAGCLADPSVGMAFAPRQVVTDDVAWQRRYGNLHRHFRNLQRRNDGRTLVRQMALRGAADNWVGEPTCVMFRRALAIEAGGFRDDVYLLVDLEFWLRLMLRTAVCFVPQELSVRSHSSTTATSRIVSDRRSWLDNLHVLTWLTQDPAAPASVRLLAALWWLPRWVGAALDVVVWGPDRRSRMATLALAPWREYSRARRLRAELASPRMAPTRIGGAR